MPSNTGIAVGTSSPVIIADFDSTTSFLNIQNNDLTNTLTVGFSELSTSATEGMLIRPGETYPIPLNGTAGALYGLGLVGVIPAMVVKG